MTLETTPDGSLVYVFKKKPKTVTQTFDENQLSMKLEIKW